MGSIYDQIGGIAAVSATVEELYARVLRDAALVPFFDGVDPDRQKRHMRDFLSVALGSEGVYDGREMRAAHAGLEVTDLDFDRLVGHLAATLHGLGVGPEQSLAILSRLAPLRSEIVTA